MDKTVAHLQRLERNLIERLSFLVEFRALERIREARAALEALDGARPPLAVSRAPSMIDEAFIILAADDELLTVHEIIDRMKRKGWEFTATYPAPSLAANMSRDERFQSTRQHSRYGSKNVWTTKISRTVADIKPARDASEHDDV